MVRWGCKLWNEMQGDTLVSFGGKNWRLTFYEKPEHIPTEYGPPSQPLMVWGVQLVMQPQEADAAKAERPCPISGTLQTSHWSKHIGSRVSSGSDWGRDFVGLSCIGEGWMWTTMAVTSVRDDALVPDLTRSLCSNRSTLAKQLV